MVSAEPALAHAAPMDRPSDLPSDLTTDLPTDLPTLTVTVVHAAAPHRIDCVTLTLPAGTTARDALRVSGLGDRLDAEALDTLSLGLGGRACEPGAVLRDGDRLELLRPLQVDPKEARRQRYRRDGLRKRRRGA